MKKTNKNSDPKLEKLKELRDKVKKAIKRLDVSIAIQDKKYAQELADYEIRYGKYEE